MKMARITTKNSIFGEGDSYSFRLAIQFGQIERVSKFIEERYATVNLEGLLHYALLYGQLEIVRLLLTKFKCSVDYRNESGETSLHLACRKGDRDIVQMLVSEYKADLLARDNDNNMPLSKAVSSGHDSVVSCLIEEFRCSPNIKGFKGQSLLHQAFDSGNEELAKGLLSNYHQDPLAVDDNGDTILHIVASNGSVDMLNFLIAKYKCPIDSKNNRDETPLHYACKKGNKAVVRVLISQHKANVHTLDSKKFTPLDFAALKGQTDVVKCLIDEFNSNPVGYQGVTILQVACNAGHVDLAETLIAHYNLHPKSVDNIGDTSLHYAAMFCDQKMINLLITKYECPVDSRNCIDETPLHWACQNGNVKAVRILILEHDADPSVCRNDKSTPLNEAALNGHTNVVKCLIDEFGCDPNVKGDQNRTILHSACRGGHTDLVETLVSQYSLDPLFSDDQGETPIHLAAHYGHQEVVNLLITKYKCSVESSNSDKQTLLHVACIKGHYDLVKMLISEHKADMNTRDGYYKRTPLHLAVLFGHTKIVKCLIDEYKYIADIKSSEGTDILYEACSLGYIELAELMLEYYDLDPLSIIDKDGNTSLHTAASNGQKKVVNLLLSKYKCPVDHRNNTNRTPLHCACNRGDLGTVKMLVLEYKADLLARDKDNNTPLVIAVSSGHDSVVSYLIHEFKCSSNFKGQSLLHQVYDSRNEKLAKRLLSDYHVDPLAVDDNGDTILHAVASNGSEEMLSLLIREYKCPINAKNNHNQTPLHYACKRGNVTAVRVLIAQHKADMNARDSKDNTPLAFATSNGHTDVVKCLIDEFNCSPIVDKGIIGLMKKNEVDKESNHLLPVIPREGYICAAQNSICIVQIPSDKPISVIVDSVDDETLHPKLHAREFLLTPVVRISSDINVFSPDKQAVVEILKTTELHDSENNSIPMFSNTHPSQPPQWRDLNPDDFEVLQDRIVFNTTHFSLFTVIARLPTPTNSITITRHKEDQEPFELTLPEMSSIKVVIPPSSIKSESAETEVKITANFDHPSLCDESVDATACITLEPHGLEFNQRIPIRIPIPDYAQITKMYSDAKLQFLHSNDRLDSKSANWMIIPEGEYEIVKEDDEYIGIVYSTHFSNRKGVWHSIPKINRKSQGPIHEFRKCIAKWLLKSFSGRCQVFMSSETVIGNVLNFSITALLHPLQECHEIPDNYVYKLYDSEKMPIKVKGSSLKLTVQLADYYSKEPKKVCKEVRLSGDFSARADFNIILDSSTCIIDGAVLGELLIEQGKVKAHTMNLLKVIL